MWLCWFTDYDRFTFVVATVDDTTDSQNVETTLISISSEKTSETINWPYTVLYITSSFIGILTILCCAFVSIYFYKHCRTAVNVTGKKGAEHIPSAHYSSLGGNIHHQNENSGDTAYLEPISSYMSHYNQIIDPNEKDESVHRLTSTTTESEKQPQTYETDIFPHSQSFPCPPTVNDSKSGQPIRKLHFSNSL